MVKTGVWLSAAAAVLLAGCVNFSALDDLDLSSAPPAPFNKALYDDYAFLAHSFGEVGQASYTTFDQEGSISLARTRNDIAALANEYAAKAVSLSQGQMVDPEPSKDLNAHNMRDRLVRALAASRDAFPRDAARAQADYDCWQLNQTVQSQMAAADACQKSLSVTLPRLEQEVRSLPSPKADTAKKEGEASPEAATP